MNKISILDATLRDGGYCNQWEFGYHNIKKILKNLADANIDIIECGFITNKVIYNKERSKFTNLDEIAAIIPENKSKQMIVGMMNFGEYDIRNLPCYDGRSIDGIRVAFHKKDMEGALQVCKEIKEKGYKVFVQAMVSLNYTDEEFLELIKRCNEIEPYAFYIVDSFGVMKRKDLVRFFYVVEHNLKENICIGYHSHNNMQLAYANAQVLVDIQTKRDVIIDSCVFGMGRGAGNLNTELFAEFLNDSMDCDYDIRPLLVIIDEAINQFYQRNYWGYSLPNYLSAKYNTHPNYAKYLDAKKTLTAENIDEIFMRMEDAKRSCYDKSYIEDLYIRYMETGNVIENHLTELKERIRDKKVLVIAPGKSLLEERDKIISVAGQKDIVSISVNFDYMEYDVDYIFISNKRRFRELSTNKRMKCIITSNISSTDVYLQTKYKELLNDIDGVKDNAAMMLIKFLMRLNVKEILLAGLDGYSVDISENFVNPQMNFYAKKPELEAMNKGMSCMLKRYMNEVKIRFITSPRYVVI